jgi:hypothetical protein
MDNQAAQWLAALAGLLIASLVVGLVGLALRLLRLVGALLRAPRRQARIALARLRGLRLTRLRALARHQDARAAAAAGELARLRAELRIALAERDAARAELAQAAAARPARRWPWRRPAGPDDRFQRAKRAFAMRFHPDRLSGNPAERAIRTMLFREHWAELRRIERG